MLYYVTRHITVLDRMLLDIL